MTGYVVSMKNGVVRIKGDDGAIYYGVSRRKIKPGTEVGFTVNEHDNEVADDIGYFGFSPEYSFRDNLISALIGLLIGAAAVFLMVYPVHAAELSSEDITLMAKLVSAEAENQPLQGKRYVASVLLNRLDSEQFPDSIEKVIFQSGQFSVIENGAWDKAIPTEEDYETVRQEVKKRSDTEIIYFTAGRYGKYGTPAFRCANHFFSK